MTDRFNLVFAPEPGVHALAESLEGFMHVEESKGNVVLHALDDQDFRGDYWAQEALDILASLVDHRSSRFIYADCCREGRRVDPAAVPSSPYALHVSDSDPVPVASFSEVLEMLADAPQKPWYVRTADSRKFGRLNTLDQGYGPLTGSPWSSAANVVIEATPGYPEEPLTMWIRSQVERQLSLPEASLNCTLHHQRSDAGQRQWSLAFSRTGHSSERMTEKVAALLSEGRIHGFRVGEAVTVR